jgi:uncharacterized membrane protein (UPF0127 family)
MRRITAAILTLALTLAAVPGCGSQSSGSGSQTTQTVQIDGKTFELELALTPQARYDGLSGRDHIDKRGGMLFVFPEPTRTHFVMRDCNVPIDLMFLDSDGRILQTHQMPVEPGPPWTRYPSRYPAQFAIELKGGMFDKLDLQSIDRIDLPTQRLKARAE